MLNKIFAVKDLKADMFNNPMFAINQPVMFRQCEQIANDPNGNQYTEHPTDFVLYELGEYDQGTGQMLLHDVPKPICDFTEFKRAVPTSMDEGVVQ